MGQKRISKKYSEAQKARRAKQTPEELSEIGRSMATSRWSTKTKKQKREYALMMVSKRKEKKAIQ
jgi:hypothetical protein